MGDKNPKKMNKKKKVVEKVILAAPAATETEVAKKLKKQK